MHEHSTSIWYFIGLLLVIYGVLILGTGLYELGSPPSQSVVLSELRAGIWWGALILTLGGVYTYVYSPKRRR